MESTRRRSHFTSWERTEETRELVLGKMIQRITLLIVRGLISVFLRAARKVGMSVLRARRRSAIGAMVYIFTELEILRKVFK